MAARLVEYLLYPFVLVGSLAWAIGMLEAGWAPAAIVPAVSLLFALLCFACERLFPETPRWRLDAGELRADLLHAALSNPVPTALYRALFFTAIVGISDAITARLGLGLWPQGCPLLAQVTLALLVAEAASYAIHRFLHESRLWPLHAVHHCSPRTPSCSTRTCACARAGSAGSSRRPSCIASTTRGARTSWAATMATS
jgi:sterol desaturase/sphingolipid hydroxylase (fatty acid hydroxylase superfamily)